MPDSASRSNSTTRGISVACFVAFAAAAAAAVYFARLTGLPMLRALALLSAWATLVAFGGTLPATRPRLRAALWLGLAALAGRVLWTLYFQKTGASISIADDSLRLVTVVFAVLAFVLYFFGAFTAHARNENDSSTLRALIPMARLLAAAFALVTAALMVWLHAQKDWLVFTRQALHFTVGVLFAEAVVRWLARLYQPARLRSAEGVGHSVLLPALFGEAGPLKSLAATLEKTFGVSLRDAWLVQLGRTLAAPLVLAGLLAAWVSTGVTRIPVDSRGVKMTCGKFADAALAPGLHFHAPWPWGRVEIVATENVREVAIGFERDLGTPVLWAEKHFDGEQNILVGAGEELLTVNVPIHYRIADAVAWLRHASDTRLALESIGYHELLRITGTHTAFGLMTTDRDAVSAQLRTAIQAAADRLALGVKIVFVGLKDIHPPVAVTPAYQDVVSAEEQRVSLVDMARASAVQAVAATQAAALQMKLQADSAAIERVARAQGEAARFLAPLAAWDEHPAVMSTRLRMEEIETTLAAARQLYIVPAGRKLRTAILPSGTPAPVIPGR